MGLLHELDGAELVIADEDLALLFVWYGGAGVQILDESGNVLDTFSISTAFERKLTTREVRRAIDGYRTSLAHEDES